MIGAVWTNGAERLKHRIAFDSVARSARIKRRSRPRRRVPPVKTHVRSRAVYRAHANRIIFEKIRIRFAAHPMSAAVSVGENADAVIVYQTALNIKKVEISVVQSDVVIAKNRLVEVKACAAEIRAVDT